MPDQATRGRAAAPARRRARALLRERHGGGARGRSARATTSSRLWPLRFLLDSQGAWSRPCARRAGMGRAAREREQDRRTRIRLRAIHHYEQVTRHVSRTCRFFGISRTIFYRWLSRYRHLGLVGLRRRPAWPAAPPVRDAAIHRRADSAGAPRASVRSASDQFLPAAVPPGLCVGPHDPPHPQTATGPAGVLETLSAGAQAPPGDPEPGPIGPSGRQAPESCRSTKTSSIAGRFPAIQPSWL
jgi:transposase-like protein